MAILHPIYCSKTTYSLSFDYETVFDQILSTFKFTEKISPTSQPKSTVPALKYALPDGWLTTTDKKDSSNRI